MSDALSPVLKGVVAALVAHAGVGGKVGDRIYSDRAPQGAALDYIVIVDMNARTLGRFRHQRGLSRGECSLRLWCHSSLDVADLYSEVKAALDAVTLDLDGADSISGSTEFVTAISDPADGAGVQGVVRYAWAAQVVG